MSSQGFFYISIGTGFLILVGFLCYTAFSLSGTLKKATSILAKVDDIAEDAEELKNFIKSNINKMMLFLKNIFVHKNKIIKKGGDKDGK